ncbi:MAG: NAD+ synthase [Elusimicrobia bacterium]|nr:NAD+ synthase [Candidatus Liberimonas magnetica]
MRIALAQINPIVGDLKGNAEKILQYVKIAKSKGADIVAFPELSVCGYPPQDLLLKEAFVEDTIKALKDISSKISGIVAILGCVTKDDKNRLYNSAVLIKDRKIKAVYNKIELPNYGVFDEKRYFHHGNEIPLFKLGNTVFGVSVCEDLWLARVTEEQKQKGAQAVFNISSSPYHIDKASERTEYIGKKARRLGLYIFYTNTVGGQDELVFDGNSLILGPDGKEKMRAKPFEEDIIFYDMQQGSCGYPDNTDYIDLGGIKGKKPLLKKRKIETIKGPGEVYRALVLATRDYVKKNCFKKVVIGISGGIDSALTAVLACDAVGRGNVMGVTMPSMYSSNQTRNDAIRFCRDNGINIIEIPIQEIYYTYINSLSKEFKGLKTGSAEENLQARIRGNILMAFSNKFGWLVLSTGNKSEVSCGYSTIYGDMVGGFNILKDVYKTRVYELSRYVNRCGKYTIPGSIIKRPPTAELRPNQKDSDSLPPYRVLDRILKLYIEQDMGYEQITRANKFKPETVRKVIKLVDRNEFKRRQAPPGIRITKKGFDKDRRMPITNKYGC